MVKHLLFGSLWCFAAPLLAKPVKAVPQLRASLYGDSKGIKCPIRIVPGESFGALKLGQTMADLKTSGMAMKTTPELPSSYLVGMFVVRIDHGRVISISAELADLPPCVSYNNKRLHKSMSLDKLRNIFKGCAKNSGQTIGGNAVNCGGVILSMGGWGGTQKSVSINVESSKK